MSQNNIIQVKSIKVSSHRIDYDYEVIGDWAKYFNPDEKLFVEFSTDISKTPASIAVIPLLGNILPIAWICDAIIYVPTIDQSFYNSIPMFKNGYIEMHKKISFKGELVSEAIENNINNGDSGCLSLFSGGVDAFNTLVMHVTENPTLVTLWGSDIKLDDQVGWNIVSEHIDSVCAEFKLNSVKIKSNFRTFISEGQLDDLVKDSGDGWWHGFQHGLGIISHTAPIAYTMNKSTVYIASSFTIANKGISCASDPTIDNYIRFGSTHVVHDGYEFDRQMKICNISNYKKQTQHKIKLHVCWISRGGNNCCRCEKCLRTIMGLYAQGDEPRNYGFDYNDFLEICSYFKDNRWMISKIILPRWEPIQKALKSNYSYSDVPSSLRWFYNANLSKFNPYPLSLRIKNKLSRLLSAFK